MIGTRVMVLFGVASSALDPSCDHAKEYVGTYAKTVWCERRILGYDDAARTVRLLDYHLEPIDVPIAWLREVPS